MSRAIPEHVLDAQANDDAARVVVGDPLGDPVRVHVAPSRPPVRFDTA